ncbi:MAG: hypothetical protein LBR36_00860 [Bacteroidales bacterium]|jgi:hypothetical protein|nr:hypothetical protein [Bacteroidales bacterium]
MYFSKEEKEWIKKIVNLYLNGKDIYNLDDMVRFIFERKIIPEPFDENVTKSPGLESYWGHVLFLLKQGEGDNNSEKEERNKTIKDVVFPVMRFEQLLKYLQEKKMIYFTAPFEVSSDTKELGDNDSTTAIDNKCKFFYIQLTPTSGDFLSQHQYDFLIITSELIELTKNNFISEEEERYKKRQCAVWTSIIVSATIGIGGIIVSALIGFGNLIISAINSIINILK